MLYLRGEWVHWSDSSLSFHFTKYRKNVLWRTLSEISFAVFTRASFDSLLGFGIDITILLPSITGVRLIPHSRIASATALINEGSNTDIDIFVGLFTVSCPASATETLAPPESTMTVRNTSVLGCPFLSLANSSVNRVSFFSIWISIIFISGITIRLSSASFLEGFPFLAYTHELVRNDRTVVHILICRAERRFWYVVAITTDIGALTACTRGAFWISLPAVHENIGKNHTAVKH